MENLTVEVINQLSDNYCYVIYEKNNSSCIVIDPAEAEKIIYLLKEKKLNLEYILITHHHSDHTSGVLDLIKEYPEIKIYSPSDLPLLSINKISQGDKIITSINEFQIISAPGHTLDHVILCDHQNNLLFVGDVLFRLGCGRIFEGTYEQMQTSLQKILKLSDDMTVYCGHEYTKNNLKFLEYIFDKNKILQKVKKEIFEDMSPNGKSIPFNLGKEKKYNPFLNQECEIGSKFKKKNKYSNLDFFKLLRDKKDDF
jgi:hydroxyacylglutathione hydrolase